MFIKDVTAIITSIGLTPLATMPSGKRDTITIIKASAKRSAKLNMFLHKKVHTMYNIAITTFMRTSRRCIGEEAG